jgi:predicted XRE-type DNA-binding protein
MGSGLIGLCRRRPLHYKQKHIAAALGVSEATMSRMMPKDLPAFQNGKPKANQ